MNLYFLKSRLGSAAVIASLAASSCKSVEPTAHAFVVAVDPASRLQSFPTLLTTSPGATGQVVVTGQIVTSSGGYRLSGRVRSIGADSITLVVLAHRSRDTRALDVVTPHNYTATVDGLPSGTYNVRLTHAWQYMDYSEIVQLDTTVVIP